YKLGLESKRVRTGLICAQYIPLSYDICHITGNKIVVYNEYFFKGNINKGIPLKIDFSGSIRTLNLHTLKRYSNEAYTFIINGLNTYHKDNESNIYEGVFKYNDSNISIYINILTCNTIDIKLSIGDKDYIMVNESTFVTVK
ncbi:MAG: hypothetical protein ACRCTZ_20700, partial [Sarcina sp.]